MNSLIVLLIVSAVHSYSPTTTINPPFHQPTRLYSAVETSTPNGESPKVNGMSSNQDKYGVSLEYPETYVRCSRCATAYALKPEDLGARGRRLSCSVCSHSWYQTPERLFTLNEGSEFVTLPEYDKTRIKDNMEAGRNPDFKGDTKLYVGNLDFSVEAEDLRELFEGVGVVGEVSMAIGQDGRKRGFAFVTMMEKDMYDKCVALNGTDLKGREIIVNSPNN